jgi:hypothetical protein
MAESTLSIAIKALVEGLDEVRALAEELTGLSTEAEAVGDSTEQAAEGNKDLADSAAAANPELAAQKKEADELNKSLDSMVGFLKKAALAWLGYLGISSAKALIDEAASSQELSNSLIILGGSAGIAKEQMDGLVDSIRQMGLSENAATEGLIKLTKAGVDLTSTTEKGLNNAQRLAKVAQDIAAVSGKDTREVFNSINRSIEIGNTRLLRQLGIKIDQQAAEEKFIATLNDGTVVLNEQQKAQATLNAILDAGVKVAGAYEASLGTAAGLQRELTKQTEDLVDLLGAQLLPAWKFVLELMIDVSKTFQALVSNQNDAGEGAKLIGDSLKGAFDAVGELIKSALTNFVALKDVAGLLLIPLADAVKFIAELVTGVNKSGEGLNFVKAVLTGVGLILAGVVDGVKLLYAAFLLVLATVDKLSFGLLGVGDQATKEANKIIDAFKNGETSVGKYIKAIETAKEAGKNVAPPPKQFDEYEKEIKEIEAATKKFSDTNEESIAGLTKIREAMSKIKDPSEALQKSLQALDARIDTLTQKLRNEYLAALKSLNIAPEQLTGGIDRATAAIIQNFDKIIAAGPKTQQAINKAFELNLDALKNYDSLAATIEKVRQQLIKTFGEGGLKSREFQQSLDQTKRKFDELLPSMLKVADTDAEFVKLREQIENFGKQGVLSVAAVGDAMAKLADRQDEFSREFAKKDLVAPLRELGTTIREVETEIGESARRVGQSLDTIAKAAQLTGEQFQKVFSKGLDTAKTIQDLRVFKGALDDASRSGVVGFTDLRQATEKLTLKFKDLFDAQLKSARTSGDFDQLKKSVQQLGEAGVLTAQQVGNALKDITEKARGFNEEIVRLAQQTAEVAEQRLAIVKAQSDAETKLRDIKKAQLVLEDDLNKAREVGTDQAKAQVEADKARIKVLEQERNLALLKAQEEQANMDLLLAKQAELNALRELEKDPTNAAAEAALKAAKDEVATREVIVSQIKEAVANEEAMVERTRQVAEEAQRVADAFGSAANQAKQFTFGNVQVGVTTFDNLVQRLRAMGLSLVQARGYAESLMGSMRALVGIGFEAAEQMFRIEEGLRDIAQRLQEDADIAQRVSDAYDSVAGSAEAAAEAMVEGGTGMKSVALAGEQLAAVFGRIRRDAQAVVRAANDAATGFLDRVLGIRVELLRQQGKEIEATKVEFDQRRKQLALEEKMLEIKIRAAQITARAAGLKQEAAELEKFLQEVRKGFAQADADLVELERIALENLRKAEEERRKSETERLAAEKKVNQERLTGLEITEQTGAVAFQNAEAYVNALAEANDAIVKAQQSSLSTVNSAQQGTGAFLLPNSATVAPVNTGGDNSTKITQNVTIHVDGKDLLDENQLDLKVRPYFEKLARRSK